MSFLAPDSAAQPEQPKTEMAPPPVLAPVGKKPKVKNPAATFIGGEPGATVQGPASGNNGGKTLIGS